MSSNDSGNAAQWEHWNSVAGPKWVAFSDRLDRALTEVGQILLQAADPLRDEAVLARFSHSMYRGRHVQS